VQGLQEGIQGGHRRGQVEKDCEEEGAKGLQKCLLIVKIRAVQGAGMTRIGFEVIGGPVISNFIDIMSIDVFIMFQLYCVSNFVIVPT
jgi:hypothetical protein